MVLSWVLVLEMVVASVVAEESSVIFDLGSRPLHMADVILSVMQGKHKDDVRTADLTAQKSLGGLQLFSPCGWFWHSPGLVDNGKASLPGSFIDKTIGEESTRSFSTPLSIMKYDRPMEMRQHKVFDSEVPVFGGLDSLTPHQWNFVKALNGNPDYVSLESSKWPDHFVHHVLSGDDNQQAYRLMMSHRSQLDNEGDASWKMGNAFGKYDTPLMITFRTTNLDKDHHIVHHCSRDASGNLQCDLILAPQPGKVQARPEPVRAAATTTTAQPEENVVVKAAQYIESFLPSFGFTEEVSPEESAENRAQQAQSAEVHLADPDVKDFDNASAFYIHNQDSIIDL